MQGRGGGGVKTKGQQAVRFSVRSQLQVAAWTGGRQGMQQSLEAPAQNMSALGVPGTRYSVDDRGVMTVNRL